MDYNFFTRNYFMISELLIEYGRGKKESVSYSGWPNLCSTIFL